MAAHYCMKCGSPNALGAQWCKRCSAALGPSTGEKPKVIKEPTTKIVNKKRGDILPVPPQNTTILANAPEEDEHEFEESKPNSAIRRTDILQEEITAVDDTEGDGLSLDFVPEIAGLEIESIQVDEVKGVSFASLVEQAQREKALKAV